MTAVHALFIIDIYHYHSSFCNYNKTKEELLFAAVCIFCSLLPDFFFSNTLCNAYLVRNDKLTTSQYHASCTHSNQLYAFFNLKIYDKCKRGSLCGL